MARPVPAWVKRKGFSTWKSYMDSIRPSRGQKYTFAGRKKSRKVKKNPGASWHRKQADEVALEQEFAGTERARAFLAGKRAAHTESEMVARNLGMNPPAWLEPVSVGQARWVVRWVEDGREQGRYFVDKKMAMRFLLQLEKKNPRQRWLKRNPKGYRYTGTQKFPSYVESAITRYLNEGVRGIDWTFFHQMNKQNRDHFDKYLMSIQHPLIYKAGTQEQRFKEFIRDYVIPYIEPENRNPIRPRTKQWGRGRKVSRRVIRRMTQSKGYRPRRYVIKSRMKQRAIKNPIAVYSLNPNNRTLIYNSVLEIRARKDLHPQYKGQRFKHVFHNPYPKVYGLSNGDLLITSGGKKPLWTPDGTR